MQEISSTRPYRQSIRAGRVSLKEMSSPKNILLPLLALCLAPLLSAGPEDDRAYQQLADRAKNGDMTVDFRAMRLACLKASQCFPRSTKAELLSFNPPGQDPKKSAEIGERLLEKGFVNAEIHGTLTALYTKLGDSAKANFHANMLTALARSISMSGDGKSKETAFEVITDREEYVALALLQLSYFGPQVTTTRLRENGHIFNRFTIQDPKTNQPRIVYFREDLFVPKSVVGKE
jgi:hypothetical protein